MPDTIDSTLKALEKEFGAGTVRRSSVVEDIVLNKTGSINLDMALGGGFPAGKIIEIYGPEMSGKTTIALIHVAEFLRTHLEDYAVFIDLERALDPDLLDAYGIDRNRFLIAYPVCAEQAFDMMVRWASLENCKIIILDSIAALCPITELTDEMEKQTMGLVARVIGKGLRKLVPVAYKNSCEIIFINQLRATMAMYGSPETTPGGRALKFAASQRLDVRKGEPIEDSKIKEIIGHQVRIKVQKNKVSIPFKQCTFNLIYGVGVEKETEIADMLIITGKIQKGGAWLKFVDEEGKPLVRKLPRDLITEDQETINLTFQGKDSLVNYLKLDESFYNLMEKWCYGEEITQKQITNEI